MHRLSSVLVSKISSARFLTDASTARILCEYWRAFGFSSLVQRVSFNSMRLSACTYIVTIPMETQTSLCPLREEVLSLMPSSFAWLDLVQPQENTRQNHLALHRRLAVAIILCALGQMRRILAY